jgi:hypothetical protein
MEKVENLCRTAPAQNDSIHTAKQIRSRLRDTARRPNAAFETTDASDATCRLRSSTLAWTR